MSLKVGLILAGLVMMTLSSWIIYSEVKSGRTSARGIGVSRDDQPVGYVAALVYNAIPGALGFVLFVAGLVV